MVLLGERVLNAMVNCISWNLPTVLSGINAEHVSGVQLAEPEAYYMYRRALSKDNAVYCETWVDQVDNADLPTNYSLVGKRHKCDVKVQVRITFINRKGASPGDAHIIGQRYAAALARVFLFHPQLDAGPEIQFAHPENYVPSEARIEDAGLAHVINQVTATLTVAIEESGV